MKTLLAFSLSLVATASFAADQPNFILILADDLGYGDLGCYGQKLIQTPNLDRMAREGIRFTQFYAGSPVCAPSRSVLMTGQHAGRTRVRGNAGQENKMAQTLRPEDTTVAEVLKKAGYATALTGKWGLGELGSGGEPTRQGFDFFFGYLNQHHAHNYYPAFLIRNDATVALKNVVPGAGEFGQGWAAKKVQYSPDLIAAEGLKWIEQNKARPFFLYLAVTLPHANNEGARGTGNGQEIPDYGIYKDKDWTEPNKGQAAMITRLDADLGRVIELLKRLGLDEKTLVFFSSDNGPHREGKNDPEFFQASGPLRGMKRALYEGGIRVPTVARWPGKIAPGQVSEHVGHFADLLPTFAELAGADSPPHLDGISFAPLLQGQHERQKRHEHLYWEFHEGGTKQAALFGSRWKGVRLRPGAALELYDLANDIGEQRNVASEHPELVAKMDAYLNTARVDSPDWPIRDPGKRAD
ncbi:MAG: arylsulfatase [Verrucomicrobiota bacterium]|nr:arylsulfatase [Verrucomicrobiota bacterium]